MTNVIAIANQKGGVGKTTTAINLAGALTEDGLRILCIDMDPQANLTAGLGINLNTVETSMADVLVGRATIEEIIRPTETQGIDIAPAHIGLAATVPEHRGAGAQSALLATRIARARDLGCRSVYVETGERRPDRPDASYRNILRAGFEELYVLANWLSPAP